MNYKILVLKHDEINKIEWDLLCDKCKDAMPFASYSYYSMFNPYDVYYIIVIDTDNQKYLGGIPGRIIAKLPLFKNYFATFLIESSILLDDNISDDNLIIELKTSLYKRVIELANHEKVIQVLLNHWTRENDLELLRKINFSIEDNSTYIIYLSNPLSEITIKYNENCKRNIKKAQKKGVYVSIFENKNISTTIDIVETLGIETFNRAMKKNKKSTIKSKSRLFYEKLAKTFQTNTLVAVAFSPQNIPISYAIIFFSKSYACYYRGGSRLSLNREFAGSNLIFHNLIELFKIRGIEIFDFGGIPNNPNPEHPAFGVFQFKKSFGGDLAVYYAGYRVLRPFKYWLFKNFLQNKYIIYIYNKLNPLS